MNERSREFLAKAEKWLRWSDTSLNELSAYGVDARHDDVERVFIGLLSSITTLHEALVAAANSAGLTEWSVEMDKARNKDSVLLYVWKARDSETHDALLKWSGKDMRRLGIKIVDRQAALQTGGMFYQDKSETAVMTRLAMYIYGARNLDELSKLLIVDRVTPSEERMRQAGVVIQIADTLRLHQFAARDKKGKRISVKEPTRHFGKHVEPSAHAVAETALHFYREKFAELTSLLDLRDASEQQSPQGQTP